MNDDTDYETDRLGFTANIVAAYVSHNTIVAEKLPDLVSAVYAALDACASSAIVAPREELKPAVPVKKSVTPDFIICLEDGKQFKSMRRHLRTCYNMSPEEYRTKWGLPHDYPVVAKNYADARSHLARTMGLGQRKKVA